MKKLVCLIFGCLFLFASASAVLAHGRHDRRGSGHDHYRGHHNYYHHHHYHPRWYGYPHYYSYRWYPWYYDDWYYESRYPWPRYSYTPPPVVVEKERVVEKVAEPEERIVSEARLDALRTQAARDFRAKTPMSYDIFDSMLPEERRAYGEEWDRLMLVSGNKGPFFKKTWR